MFRILPSCHFGYVRSPGLGNRVCPTPKNTSFQLSLEGIEVRRSLYMSIVHQSLLTGL